MLQPRISADSISDATGCQPGICAIRCRRDDISNPAIREVLRDEDQRITALDPQIARRVEYRFPGLRWNHSNDNGIREGEPYLSELGHLFCIQLAYKERVVLMQAQQLPIDGP